MVVGFGSAEAGICELDTAGVGADTVGGEGIMVVVIGAGADIMVVPGFGVATGDSKAVSESGRHGVNTVRSSSVKYMSDLFAALQVRKTL
jgi:hypothetical protein